MSVPFRTVFGVDFSGARLAGKTAWVAELGVRDRVVRSLASLEALAGDPSRERAHGWLVGKVLSSERALFGIDAPFGLPVELFREGAAWAEQLHEVARFPDAREMGRSYSKQALARFGVMHVRRETDKREKTPFDCYHYRIAYQTFHAMRDVLTPLARDAKTAVVPFQYARLAKATRVVVEACPSSTLLHVGAPRRGYKEPGGRDVSDARVAVRKRILSLVAPHAKLSRSQRATVLEDPGGDALDAVLAAVGALRGWMRADHVALARDPRVTREGWVFA